MAALATTARTRGRNQSLERKKRARPQRAEKAAVFRAGARHHCDGSQCHGAVVKAAAVKKGLNGKIQARHPNHAVALEVVRRAAFAAMRGVAQVAGRRVALTGAVIGVAQIPVGRIVLAATMEVGLGAVKKVALDGAVRRAVVTAVIGVAHKVGSRVGAGAETRLGDALEVAGALEVANAPPVADVLAVAVSVAVLAAEVCAVVQEVRVVGRILGPSGVSCGSAVLAGKVMLAKIVIQRHVSFPGSRRCWATKCVTVAKIVQEGLVFSSTQKGGKVSLRIVDVD